MYLLTVHTFSTWPCCMLDLRRGFSRDKIGTRNGIFLTENGMLYAGTGIYQQKPIDNRNGNEI